MKQEIQSLFLISIIILSGYSVISSSSKLNVNMNKISLVIEGIDVTDAFSSKEDYDIYVKIQFKRVLGTFGDTWTTDSGYNDFTSNWKKIGDDRLLSKQKYYPNYYKFPNTLVVAPEQVGYEIKINVKITWGWFEEKYQESAYTYKLYSYGNGVTFDTGIFTFSVAGGNFQLRLTITKI